jgi:phage-related protein
MSAFTFLPATGQREIKLARREARFGDGYVQSVGDGINNRLYVWTLTFIRNRADSDAIEAFLANVGGGGFDWTDPYGFSARWRITKEGWKRKPLTNNTVWSEISVIFEQAPGL